MPNATRPLILNIALGTLAACAEPQSDQNIVITNEIPDDADVEALPPDESSGSGETVNDRTYDDARNGTQSPAD